MSGFDLSRVPVTEIRAALKYSPKASSEQRERSAFGLFHKVHGLSYAHCGGQTCVFDPMHVVLLPKGASYSITSDDPGETCTIEFDCADGFEWDSGRLTSWRLNDPALIASLFNEAARVWTFKKTAYYSRCMSILYRIFAELERESVYVSSPGREKLRAALACLEESIGNPSLSVDELAAAAGMSRSYFTKLFGRFYNMSPARYISMIRVEKAKALLSEGSLSVSEVASSVGFSSLYYFSAAFRREVGVCPSGYGKEKEFAAR